MENIHLFASAPATLSDSPSLFWRFGMAKALMCFSVFLTIVEGGCAAVIVKRLPHGDNNNVQGVRFYRPAPYLMVADVSSDSKPGSASGNETSSQKGASNAKNSSQTVQFSIVWMPDLSQEYIIHAKPGLGSVTFNPTLENGWNLTGLNASADSKTAELLTAVAGFIPKSLLGAGGVETELKPGMYRLIFQTDPNKPKYGQLVGIDRESVFTIVQ